MGCSSSKPQHLARQVPVGAVDRYRPPNKKNVKKPPTETDSQPTEPEKLTLPCSESVECVVTTEHSATDDSNNSKIDAKASDPEVEKPEKLEQAATCVTETAVNDCTANSHEMNVIIVEESTDQTEHPLVGIADKDIVHTEVESMSSPFGIRSGASDEDCVAVEAPCAEMPLAKESLPAVTQEGEDDEEKVDNITNSELDTTLNTDPPELATAAGEGEVLASRPKHPVIDSPTTPRKLMSIKSSRKIQDYEEGVNRMREEEQQRVKLIRANTLKTFGITAEDGREPERTAKLQQYETAVSMIPEAEKQRARLIRANTLKTFGIGEEDGELAEDAEDLRGESGVTRRRISISELAKSFEGEQHSKIGDIQTRNSC